MTNERMLSLLKNAVEHIEAFEEDESQNVLKALGFSENDLAEIRFKLELDEADKRNIPMVEGKLFHNGEVIWQLSHSGNEFISSSLNEYITENIPFKNYSHYFYYDETRDVYCGYAYYSPTESYAYDFNTLDECLDWLVPEHELDEKPKLSTLISSAEARTKVTANKNENVVMQDLEK